MAQEDLEGSKDVEQLGKRLENTHVNGDDNATGDSVGIIVENEAGERTSASELPSRPSSAEVLARVLEARLHLNLTGKVFVAPQAVRKKHGGAADVFEGLVNNTSEKVAVKRLRLNIGGDEKIAKNIAKEIRIWSEFQHDNILPILGYIIEGDYPSLVSTWVVNGSLREYMTKLNKKETLAMVLGIASGLAYIHTRKAIHSDLKSDNVLVSPKKEALLTDFGVSRMDALTAGYTTHSVSGSTRWQAVEFFDIPTDDAPAPTHTTKTDIWAFGMTVYELLTHKVPYYHVDHNNQVILVISQGRLPKPPELSTEGVDKAIDDFLWKICRRCWNKNPDERPQMARLEEEIFNFIKAD